MAYIQYKVNFSRKFYQLPDRMIVFGRAEHCEFQLLDNQISREHFAIHREENGEYAIIDLGARNGTFHNGRKLFNEMSILKDGDNIYAGGHRFVFLVKLPAKTTQDIVDEVLDTVQDESKGFRTAMVEIVAQASGNNPSC